MSPQSQRIAIAEACGWTRYNGKEKFQFYSPRGMYARMENLPDYLNDLNAMHEAEKVLTEEQWLSFTIYVLLASKDGTFVIGKNMKTVAHATAAQRAEAFLRTVGKWEDAK